MPRSKQLYRDEAFGLDEQSSLEDRLLAIMAESIRPRPEQSDPATALAEQSLYAFTEQAWPVLEPNNPFVSGWHIGCMCEHLQAVSALQIRNLIINIPPRHAKSLITSVFWFCWSWIKNPASRWLYTSYAAHLSLRDSDKCRTVLKSQWFLNRWGNTFRIKTGEDIKQKFVNDRQGYRIATSVGGIGTGEGGDVIVADDPHKTDETLSEAARARAVYNWDNTMSTRGNNPKTLCKVVIMQRLHERDLTGHIIAEGRDYEHLCLPAEYEPKRYYFNPVMTSGTGTATGTKVKPPRDSIRQTSLQRERPELRDGPEGSGRKEEGDLLWPERFDAEAIKSLKSELRALGTAGQLQQRPTPEQGTIFQADCFRYFEEALEGKDLRIFLGIREAGMPPPLNYLASQCRWFQTCDTAMTAKETSAWTVVGTFFLTPCRRLCLWDVWRERILVPEQFKALCHLRAGKGTYDATNRRWSIIGADRPWPSPILYQAVEEKASGIGLIQQGILEGMPFRALKADQDKVKRAVMLASMFEAKMVYFRANARMSWLTDYEGELLAFPGGAYADQVDVSSYAAQLATEDALTTGQYQGNLIADGGGKRVVSVIEPPKVEVHPLKDLLADAEKEDEEAAGQWWRRQ